MFSINSIALQNFIVNFRLLLTPQIITINFTLINSKIRKFVLLRVVNGPTRSSPNLKIQTRIRPEPKTHLRLQTGLKKPESHFDAKPYVRLFLRRKFEPHSFSNLYSLHRVNKK